MSTTHDNNSIHICYDAEYAKLKADELNFSCNENICKLRKVTIITTTTKVPCLVQSCLNHTGTWHPCIQITNLAKIYMLKM